MTGEDGPQLEDFRFEDWQIERLRDIAKCSEVTWKGRIHKLSIIVTDDLISGLIAPLPADKDFPMVEFTYMYDGGGRELKPNLSCLLDLLSGELKNYGGFILPLPDGAPDLEVVDIVSNGKEAPEDMGPIVGVQVKLASQIDDGGEE